MPSVVVGGVTIPVAPSDLRRDRIDAVDRARAFDNTYRASATGTAKRVWSFTTPPVSRAASDVYERILATVTAQTCSGDVLGGAKNLVLQSENFGTTWVADGTPTRVAAAHITSGITLDLIGDDSGAAVEYYWQTVGFTGNDVKAVSLFVKQGSAVSSVVQLIDVTAANTKLLGVITWASGAPVVTMTTGTFRGHELVTDGVYRLLFSSASVTAANNNILRVFPATNAATAVGDTGTLYAGGVQAEDSSVPGSYVPTTTATVDTRSVSCFSEIAGWSPVRLSTGHRVALNFVLHEA